MAEVGHNSVNGTGSQKTTRGGRNTDPAYLSPFKRSSRPGLSDSRSGSDADSLIDLYGHPRSVAGKSIGENSDKTDRSEYRHFDHTYNEDEEDPERSRWIHRDKLALIESKEMEEAGIIHPSQPPRAASRSKSRREPSQERCTNSSTDFEPEVHSTKEGGRRRIQSPARHNHQEEEGEEKDSSLQDFDLRTPEEIAGESYLERNNSPTYRQQGLRSSSSRIPLPRSSPMPIPQEHIERNTPLLRKRGTSSEEEDNNISYSYARSRNNSIGSQALLDDSELAKSPTAQHTPDSRPPSQGSPSKIRAPGNRTPHTQKTSSSISTPTLATPKPRSTSTNTRSPSNTIRPKSRSGLEPRPPTAINRPEGDPPWLATMYKPDPRLPPEQQILPTHAKRLQQEQWEKGKKESEGRQPQIARDGERDGVKLLERGGGEREFSPLAVHTWNGLQPPSSPSTSRQGRQTQEEEREEQKESGREWPLAKSGPKPSPAAGQISPGNEAGRRAEYSTTPRIKQEQDIGSNADVPGSKNAARVSPQDPFEKERRARMEGDGKVERKKEKGCACCAVM